MRDVSPFVCLATFLVALAGCNSTGDTARLPDDAGGDDAPVEEEDAGLTPEIFAHDSTTLYRFDPTASTLETVGRFSCADQGVADIAVNAAGEMFGTTSTSLVYIEKTTAECIEIARGAYPTSLGFVPAGTLDPDKDVLVGFNYSQYVRIDTDTGAQTYIGALYPNQLGVRFTISGDVVSTQSGRTFVTVKITGAQDNGDFLVEIDPRTGAVTRMLSSTKKRNLWGLGYWDKKVFAFNPAGDIYSVRTDIDGGQAHSVTLADGGVAPPLTPGDGGREAGTAHIEFVGAAVTTLAP
jgi:hypothetical protein